MTPDGRKDHRLYFEWYRKTFPTRYVAKGVHGYAVTGCRFGFRLDPEQGINLIIRSASRHYLGSMEFWVSAKGTRTVHLAKRIAYWKSILPLLQTDAGIAASDLRQIALLTAVFEYPLVS